MQPKYDKRRDCCNEYILTINTAVDMKKRLEHITELTGIDPCESYNEVDQLLTKANENAQHMWRLEKVLTEL